MSRISRRLTATLTTSLALLACSAGAAVAAPSDLDPTFSGDGAVHHETTSVPFGWINTPATAEAPNGTLVTAGLVNEPCFPWWILTRGEGSEIPCGPIFSGTRSGERLFLSDESFMRIVRIDDGGQVVDEATIDDTEDGEIYDVRVLGEGNGTSTMVGGLKGDLIAARLDGDLNLTGPPALRDGDDACGDEEVHDLIDASIRADGTIVAVWECAQGAVVEALRFDEAGDLVPVDGFDASLIGFEDAPGSPVDLALDPSGRAYVLFTTKGWFVAKIGSGGGLDAGYGTDGIAWGQDGFPPHGDVEGTGPFAAGPDGEVVVGIHPDQSDDQWQLVRITPGGEQDAEFGENGRATLNSELVRDYPYELTIQRDRRILAVGHEYAYDQSVENRGLPTGQDGLVIARFLADGAVDGSWDGDGHVLLEVAGRWLDWAAKVVELDTGKLALPSSVLSGQMILARDATAEAPEEAEPLYLTTFRFQGTPPEQPVVQQPAQPVVQQQVVAQESRAPRSCTSRRTLRIRLRTGRPKGERSAIVSARVLVNGRRVKVTRGSRLRARINLTSLPKGRFAVKISLKLADGGVVRETRRYRTCTKKIKRQLKPLRTRAPKSARG